MDWLDDINETMDFNKYRKQLCTLLILYIREGINTLPLLGRIYRSLLQANYPKELLHMFLVDTYRKHRIGEEMTLEKYGYEDFKKYREYIKTSNPNLVTVRSRMILKDDIGEFILEIGDIVYEMKPAFLLKAVRIHDCMLMRLFQGTLEEEFIADVFEYAPVKLGGKL